MIVEQIQKNLVDVYDAWKSGLQFSDQEAAHLSPPLLLSVTDEYCNAERRILLFGQETFGWGWNSSLKAKYPDYPKNWEFSAMESMADFLQNPDSVENMCWAYQAFSFSKYQKDNYKSPFWKAFREVQAWPGAGVMWSNVSRCDYAGATSGNSIFHAPEDLREKLVISQKELLLKELIILKPHVCLFFSGPYYDPILTASFPNCRFSPLGTQPARQLAQIADVSLPLSSFRTYHPNYLNRNQVGKWEFIEVIRSSVYS